LNAQRQGSADATGAVATVAVGWTQMLGSLIWLAINLVTY